MSCEKNRLVVFLCFSFSKKACFLFYGSGVDNTVEAVGSMLPTVYTLCVQPLQRVKAFVEQHWTNISIILVATRIRLHLLIGMDYHESRF